jgi:hypothetical protein
LKNQKRTINFLIISLVLVFNVWNLPSQQVYLDGSEELLERIRLNKSYNAMEKVTYATIDGDPFLYKNFSPGKLILSTGEIFKLAMRFDIYSNQVQFKDKNEIFELKNSEGIAAIIIDTVRFQYASYFKSPEDESSTEGSYFIVKADGKCQLLIKKNIRLQAAETPKAYQEAKPAKFIHISDTYYLKLEDSGAAKVKGKKDILYVLADKKVELDKFISSNKLGTKSEEDLVKIVSYYNSL